MRSRTVLVLAVLAVLLGGAAALAFTGGSGGQLREQWVSDTARDNQVNHHAVGVGPEGKVLVAPVAAVPNAEEITATSCSLVRLNASTGAVLWQTSVPAEDCFTHALTQPAIADVDADGGLEVVAGTTQNAVVVLDAATGNEEFRIPMPAYGYGRPTVANVTPDAGPEIVASDIEGNAVVASENATVTSGSDQGSQGDPAIWRASLNATTYPHPVVGDVDGDEGVEVAFATFRGFTVFDANGSRAWENEVATTTLASGNADGDAAIEFFAASTRTLTAIDGQRGAVEWTTNVSGTPTVRSVGDGDGDGDMEVYVGLYTQHVVAFDARNGTEQWRTEVSAGEGSTMPAPVLGDLTGDGESELVTVTNSGTVVVLDPGTGRELASYERDVPVWTFPTLADTDADRGREILVRYGDGRVVALDYLAT